MGARRRTAPLPGAVAATERGAEAINAAVVRPGFQGVAVHDEWRAYATHTDAFHALRGAPHLRELIACERAGESWATVMSALLVNTKASVENAKASGLSALPSRRSPSFTPPTGR